MTEKNEKKNKSFNSSDDYEDSKKNKPEKTMVEKPHPIPSQKPEEKKINIKQEENKVNIKPKEKKININPKELEKMLKLINTTSHKKPKNNSYNILLDNFEPKKLYSNKNTKIEKGHSNIYEREKKNILRKNNSIKKKKELKEQQEELEMQIPIVDENSRNILLQSNDYIPIQERAANIYNLKQVNKKVLEKKLKMKKAEKEKEENIMIEKYKNKKPYKEYEWNSFVENQEYWYKQKLLKKKAQEIIRESIELKINYKPKIDENSKKIMKEKRKRKNLGENIFIKLYNDFSNIQEKKQLKISNSMPSFKPLLNKRIKKNVFKPNKNIENNKNNIEKQIELIIQEKLKNLKHKAQNQNLNKNISAPNFNLNLNNKEIKNMNNKNKRYENIKGKTQNISYGSYLSNSYKKTINKKSAKKL